MHIPVLLNETLQYLEPKPGDNFIDCTVGEGGHALAILKMTAPNGKVLGIDRDVDMAERLSERADALGIGDRFIIHHGNFSEIGEIARRYNFTPVCGILFDFGLSSWQLEESGAGFSFQNTEPLDMRFDRSKLGSDNTETAASIVNSWPQEAIFRILHELGEERYARRIAKEIVNARKKKADHNDRPVGRRNLKSYSLSTSSGQAAQTERNSLCHTHIPGVAHCRQQRT